MDYYTFVINRNGRVFNNSFLGKSEHDARAVAVKLYGEDKVKECLGRWDFKQKKLIPVAGEK